MNLFKKAVHVSDTFQGGEKTDAGKPKENNGNYFLKVDKDILGQC